MLQGYVTRVVSWVLQREPARRHKLHLKSNTVTLPWHTACLVPATWAGKELFERSALTAPLLTLLSQAWVYLHGILQAAVRKPWLCHEPAGQNHVPYSCYNVHGWHTAQRKFAGYAYKTSYKYVLILLQFSWCNYCLNHVSTKHLPGRCAQTSLCKY